MKSKEEIIKEIIGSDLTSSLHYDISECMIVYADQQTASLRQENERLKAALNEIMQLKTDGSKYDYNKCWNIADKALLL